MAGYSKLHQTLPSAALSALKARVKSGDPLTIQQLWASKEHTFLSIDFEWSERNSNSCLEFGYSALRCGYLNNILNLWPPVPGQNYRNGHYIIAEYAKLQHKKHTPVVPWEYSWGQSQVIPKSQLAEVIAAVISSLASPDSDFQANELVLVGHGLSGDLDRLSDLKIKLPKNTLLLDTATFERQLFTAGFRGAMTDQTGKPRQRGTSLSLGKLIQSFGIQPPSVLHNAGNDAFTCLFGLQLLLEPEGTVEVPSPTRGPNVTTPTSDQPAIHLGDISASPAVKFQSLSLNARPQAVRHDSAPLTDEHGKLLPTSSTITYHSERRLSRRI